MKSIKRFITLTGGVCFMMGALATTTVVADGVSANDKAAAVAQGSSVALAPAVTDVGKKAMAPSIAAVPTRPNLATIWDKHQCFVVVAGNCL